MTEAHAQTLRELVTRYLTEQTPANLTALRHAVRSSGSFDPDVDLRGVIPLLEAGRHREALDAVRAKMPGAALNPLAHRLLATGDGTQERPWSVLRVADEYDVMRAKGVTPRRQATRTVDGRVVDVHEVVDGPDVWFVLDPA